MMKRMQNQIENWTSLDLIMAIGSACFIDLLTG